MVLKLPLTSILLTKGLHKNNGLLFGPLDADNLVFGAFFLPPKLQIEMRNEINDCPFELSKFNVNSGAHPNGSDLQAIEESVFLPKAHKIHCEV
jgi:hypothetical protein